MALIVLQITGPDKNSGEWTKYIGVSNDSCYKRVGCRTFSTGSRCLQLIGGDAGFVEE